MIQLQIVEQQINRKVVQRVNKSILANPGIGYPILDQKNLFRGHLDPLFDQQAWPMPDGNPLTLR